jgi:hypothetical protein
MECQVKSLLRAKNNPYSFSGKGVSRFDCGSQRYESLITKISSEVTEMVVNELQYECHINLEPEEGDSNCFGWSLAANEKYLAVGDTGANRVVVYHRNSQNKWVRFRIVSLPTNPSIANSSSSCTNYKLALSKDTLIIGTVTSEIRFNEQNRQLYLYRPPTEEVAMAYSNQRTLRVNHHQEGLLEEAYTGAVYQTLVASNTPLERIDNPKPGELAGFSVAAEGEKIAFAVATYSKADDPSGYTTVISNGHHCTFMSSGEIALYNNLLVVGSTVNCQQGRVSIFDLAVSNPCPQTVNVPISIAEIALMKKFIAIEEQGSRRRYYKKSKTLILNIDELSITTLNGVGSISAYDNLLLRCHSTTKVEHYEGLMELFDTNYVPPKLLHKSNSEASQGLLTKGLLFIVVPPDSNAIPVYSENARICIFSYV